MKSRYTPLLALCLVFYLSTHGQTTSNLQQPISINNDGAAPAASAMLDVQASDKGMLLPRIILDDASTAAPVSNPATGLLIYNEGGAEPDGFYHWDGSKWVRLLAGTLPVLTDADGDTKIQVEESADEDAIHFDVGGNEALYISLSGKVGMGTDAPNTTLSINPSAEGAKVTLWDGGDPAEHFGFGISENQLNFHVYNPISSHVFYAGGKNGDGTELMRIQGGGNVGIGRNPVTNKLEVEGDASKSSAGDWLANSDARLKTNIRPLDSREMLEKLLSLQGITYEWNDDKTGSKRPVGTQYGFTAQNIRDVFPTLVKEDVLGYLQTAYGTYDAILVEGIRALYETIEELKKDNAAMKYQLSVQTDQLDKITAALENAGIMLEK